MHNIQQCSTKRHVCGFWHSHAQSVPCTCTCVAWAGRSHIKMAKGRLEEFKELSRLSHHSLRAKVHNCHALWHITLTDLEATILHGVGVHCNRIFHRIFLRVTICKLNLCISTNCTENTMELRMREHVDTRRSSPIFQAPENEPMAMGKRSIHNPLPRLFSTKFGISARLHSWR